MVCVLKLVGTIIINWISEGDKNRKFWADFLSLNDGVLIVALVSVVVLLSLYYWFRVRKK